MSEIAHESAAVAVAGVSEPAPGSPDQRIYRCRGCKVYAMTSPGIPDGWIAVKIGSSGGMGVPAGLYCSKLCLVWSLFDFPATVRVRPKTRPKDLGDD